jgi:hypothetical protein
MAVKDYNTDPDLNTSISGINIAEGCPPSGINDAIRQLMADVKVESEAIINQASTRAEAQAVKDAEQDSALATTNSNLATTNSNLATTNSNLATTNSNLAALDASVVHKTGDEEIEGVKTFNNQILFLKAPWIKDASMDIQTWVSGTNNKYLYHVDKNNAPISAVQFRMTPTVNAIRFLMRKPKDNTSAFSSASVLWAQVDNNGVASAGCVTTPAGSTGNQIVTANYANDTYLAKSGGTMTGALNIAHNALEDVSSIELVPYAGATHGGHIDFHYKADTTKDFTTRIIEVGPGVLNIDANDGSARYVGRVFTSSDIFVMTGSAQGAATVTLPSGISTDTHYVEILPSIRQQTVDDDDTPKCWFDGFKSATTFTCTCNTKQRGNGYYNYLLIAIKK